MRRLPLVLLLSLVACEKGYQSELLGVSYKPPPGFELVKEEAGPPKRADLGRGLHLYSLDVQLGDVEKLPLEPLADIVRQAAKLPEADVLTSKTGSLPTGQVVRYTLKNRAGERELMYAVLGNGRVVLVDFAAPEAVYGPLEAKVEASLGNLRIKR